MLLFVYLPVRERKTHFLLNPDVDPAKARERNMDPNIGLVMLGTGVLYIIIGLPAFAGWCDGDTFGGFREGWKFMNRRERFAAVLLVAVIASIYYIPPLLHLLV